MSGKCKLSECAAPDVRCHEDFDDPAQCPNFVSETIEAKVKKEKITEVKKSQLGWSGDAFTTEELGIVTSRSNSILIGIVGKADAGKTTFLSMLYTLLLNGKKFEGFDFAGTKTILGWDELYHRLKLQRGSVPFPSVTPVESNRLYHFALRNKDGHLKDLLFADASGEVFSAWSVNREDESAENARWIYSNVDGFMLFIDCEALLVDQNSAKKEIMLIARQLTSDLRNRPVISVWSKSDKKSKIAKTIKESIKIELGQLFENYSEIEISNFLEPGPDELVHTNNIAAVNWLLERLTKTPNPITIEVISSNDLFINYRG